MKAAVLRAHGTPEFADFPEPEPAAGSGHEVVQVLAATVNSLDRALASGTHLLSPRQLPAVCGVEGVGLLPGGRRVHFTWPVAPYGSMGERALVDPARTIDVPAGLDDAVASALGHAGWAAWLPLSWRAALEPGERVLILGATGNVGRLAVQAARLLGAGRVVAVGRDAPALAACAALGADEVLHLDQVAEAGPADVIVDYLWGAPVRAALQAAAVGVRVVQIGDRADGMLSLPSGLLRGKGASVLGFQAGLAGPDRLAAVYAQLADHVLAGRLTIEAESHPLSEVADRWTRSSRRIPVLHP
jgi:NADPH2:quinone reductase